MPQDDQQRIIDNLVGQLDATADALDRLIESSTRQLAELASKSKPKLLVLYHQLYFGPRDQVDLVKEIRRSYQGLVVNGRDLTAY